MAKRKTARTKATRKATRSARTRVAATRTKSAAGRKKPAASARRAKGRAAAKKAAPKKAAKKVVARKAAPAKSTRKKAASVSTPQTGPGRRVGTTPSARKAAPAKAPKKIAAKKAVPKKAAVRARPVTPPMMAAEPPAPAPVAAVSEPAATPKAPKKKAAKAAASTTRHSEPTGDRASIPSSLTVDRPASKARSGRQEQSDRLKAHTETDPSLTAGDVDADWEQAYSSGDEAPGGDNPTPDQDVVDDIGHALGVEYQDAEELKGADKISDRDRHRWELDPASSEDYTDRES